MRLEQDLWLHAGHTKPVEILCATTDGPVALAEDATVTLSLLSILASYPDPGLTDLYTVGEPLFTGAACTIKPDATGIVVWTPTAEQTEKPGIYRYLVRVEDGNGVEFYPHPRSRSRLFIFPAF